MFIIKINQIQVIHFKIANGTFKAFNLVYFSYKQIKK